MIWRQSGFGFDEWSYLGFVQLKFKFSFCGKNVRLCNENQLWLFRFPIPTVFFNLDGNSNAFWLVIESLK